MKNIRILSKNLHFLMVKCSVYLSRLVFVMLTNCLDYLCKSRLNEMHLFRRVNRFFGVSRYVFGFVLHLSEFRWSIRAHPA